MGRAHRQTFTSPGGGTFTVPAGVFWLLVRGIGAGGGGGGAGGPIVASTPGSGGGGGGGAKLGQFVVAVVPGTTYTYTVAAGGAGGAGGATGVHDGNPGSDGGDSDFNGTLFFFGAMGGAAGVYSAGTTAAVYPITVGGFSGRTGVAPKVIKQTIAGAGFSIFSALPAPGQGGLASLTAPSTVIQAFYNTLRGGGTAVALGGLGGALTNGTNAGGGGGASEWPGNVPGVGGDAQSTLGSGHPGLAGGNGTLGAGGGGGGGTGGVGGTGGNGGDGAIELIWWT